MTNRFPLVVALLSAALLVFGKAEPVETMGGGKKAKRIIRGTFCVTLRPDIIPLFSKTVEKCPRCKAAG